MREIGLGADAVFEHPNIKVEIQLTPWANYWDKLKTLMAGGTPPGIYGPNREEMAAMQERMQAAKV